MPLRSAEKTIKHGLEAPNKTANRSRLNSKGLIYMSTTFSHLCPVNEWVQNPPSMSHTLADRSAEAEANRAPEESTARSATGALWPCRCVEIRLIRNYSLRALIHGKER